MNSKSGSSVKLSFAGDIMCIGKQLEACTVGRVHDFTSLFADTKELFSSSDYVVGNFETPVAGESSGYTSERYRFNNPEAFAEAVRDAGFDLVSTANNHCMDRNAAGLFATLDTLDRINIDHIGTYRSREERDGCFMREINGVKVGFLAYTYGTNAFAHHMYLEDGQLFAVNLFQPQECRPGSIHLLDPMDRIAQQVEELHRPDNPVFQKEILPYHDQLRRDLRILRENGAEFIVLIMHSGGQYNQIPDPYTLKLVDMILEMGGVDAIIGHHPHIILPCMMRKNIPVAYSIGNFIGMPNTAPDWAADYVDYSVVAHLHLRMNRPGSMLEKLTFSITKSVLRPNGVATVVPLCDLIRETSDPVLKSKLLEDNCRMVNLFRGSSGSEVPFCEEYEFHLYKSQDADQE